MLHTLLFLKFIRQILKLFIMKTFKLLIASLVVFIFCFTTNVNAQEKWGNSGKYEAYYVFPCPCAGENLMGTLVFQTTGKNKMNTFTIKGHLVGETSGDSYIFNRVDNINSETGQASLRVRTVRKGDGLVTNFTIFYQDGEVWSRCM